MSTLDTFRSILDRRILVLDGAMGTMIQAAGLTEADIRGDRFADWPTSLAGANDLLVLTQPEAIRDIHRQYLEVGADIVTTNSFNAQAISLADYEMEDLAYELNVAAAQVAREACEAVGTARKPRFVAGSIGPMNRTLSLSPDVEDPGFRAVTFDQVKDAYAEQIRGLVDGGADLLLVETIFDTLNAKAALVALREHRRATGSLPPGMISGTIVDQSGRTLVGQTVEAFHTSLAHAPELLSFGLNCALGSAQMRPFIEELSEVTPAYTSLYPNAGLPNELGAYDEGPAFMAEQARSYAEAGLLNFVGGCCGTTPEHIRSIAKAVAGEAGVPFLSISGSDFVEMFVGVGASRVRDLFKQAKENSPCIIFLDEIDAVGRRRGTGVGGGHDEREQTLNQILVEMDGFDTNEGVIIIAATNRPDVLDPALLRPGRFDRQVVVPNPDIIGREAILKVHIKKINIGPDVKLRTIARGTPGFSGADLANLCNESALLAARKNKRIVTMSDIEEAKDKVMMGAERRSMVMTEDDKKLTAYHEGGHAIVALNEKASDPIHKATIIPRGRALGVVWTLPERDKYSHTREYLQANISKAMGGRVAEEIIFGHEKVTSGASSDIQMATKLAKDMVTKFGMSTDLGPLSYGANEDEVFLGRQITRQEHMSEETAKKVDIEVKKIVDAGYQRAKKILSEKIEDLHKLAKALIIYETLSGEEIKDLILKDIQPKRTTNEDDQNTEASSALGSLGLKPKPAH